jgi:hypothetical protein
MHLVSFSLMYYWITRYLWLPETSSALHQLTLALFRWHAHALPTHIPGLVAMGLQDGCRPTASSPSSKRANNPSQVCNIGQTTSVQGRTMYISYL